MKLELSEEKSNELFSLIREVVKEPSGKAKITFEKDDRKVEINIMFKNATASRRWGGSPISEHDHIRHAGKILNLVDVDLDIVEVFHQEKG